jgi:ATP-dependent Clp protease ATP-binding subunit ClpC
MTSNLGTREAARAGKGYGFGEVETKDDQTHEHMAEKMTGIMKDIFRPEFLNRVDDVIVFRSLSRDNILTILDIHLREVTRHLSEQGVSLKISAGVREMLTDVGFSSETGARTLRRTVERLMEDPLAEEILRGRLSPGAIVRASVKKGQVAFNTVQSVEPGVV